MKNAEKLPPAEHDRRRSRSLGHGLRSVSVRHGTWGDRMIAWRREVTRSQRRRHLLGSPNRRHHGAGLANPSENQGEALMIGARNHGPPLIAGLYPRIRELNRGVATPASAKRGTSRATRFPETLEAGSRTGSLRFATMAASHGRRVFRRETGLSVGGMASYSGSACLERQKSIHVRRFPRPRIPPGESEGRERFGYLVARLKTRSWHTTRRGQ